MSTIESRAWWRYMRCVIAQSIGKTIIWVVLLGAAGYAAWHSGECPHGQTCLTQQKVTK